MDRVQKRMRTTPPRSPQGKRKSTTKKYCLSISVTYFYLPKCWGCSGWNLKRTSLVIKEILIFLDSCAYFLLHQRYQLFLVCMRLIKRKGKTDGVTKSCCKGVREKNISYAYELLSNGSNLYSRLDLPSISCITSPPENDWSRVAEGAGCCSDPYPCTPRTLSCLEGKAEMEEWEIIGRQEYDNNV